MGSDFNNALRKGVICPQATKPLLGGLLLLFLLHFPAFGAMPPAWLAPYSTGTMKNTNQAVAIALDGAVNVIVAGSSTGAKDDFDYVTIKYAPNGTRLWQTRYASLPIGPTFSLSQPPFS